MPSVRQERGRTGEDLAAAYLRRRGYRILQKNYHSRGGEIDLVAEEATELVFVEVKTRRDNRFGSPEEAVTRQKSQHWQRAALAYLHHTKNWDRPYRFDFVGVDLSGKKPRIFLIKNFLAA